MMQMKQKLGVALLDTNAFPVNKEGLLTYDQIIKRAGSTNCVLQTRQFEPSVTDGRLSIPVLEDIVAYPGRQDAFTLEFDTGQASEAPPQQPHAF
jgi:hypothetical protein